MKRLIQACIAIISILTVSAFAQGGQGIKEIPYDLVPNFLKLPANLYMGEGIGVARDSKGHVYTYTRSGVTRLFEFDEKGNFLREIGPGSYAMEMAHAVRVVPQDNSRILKMDKNGKFLKTFGSTGAENGQFNKGDLYVADKGNNRIQVFDNDGNFKTQYTNVGTPSAICISPGGHQYLFSSNSNDPDNLENGEIYKMELDGKIVGKFGSAGHLLKEFGTVNAIDCPAENVLFVGELINWRVQKVTLKK